MPGLTRRGADSICRQVDKGLTQVAGGQSSAGGPGREKKKAGTKRSSAEERRRQVAERTKESGLGSNCRNGISPALRATPQLSGQWQNGGRSRGAVLSGWVWYFFVPKVGANTFVVPMWGFWWCWAGTPWTPHLIAVAGWWGSELRLHTGDSRSLFSLACAAGAINWKHRQRCH
jgi:hypothetical protein